MMTLKEANRELEHLDNELNRLLNEKELLFLKTQPKGVEIKLDPIRSSNRSDKYLDYVITVEEKQIDNQVDVIYAQRRIIENWILRELEIIGKYEPLEQRIISLRQEGKKWLEISMLVNYSERQCQRIYDKYYFNKR